MSGGPTSSGSGAENGGGAGGGSGGSAARRASAPSRSGGGGARHLPPGFAPAPPRPAPAGGAGGAGGAGSSSPAGAGGPSGSRFTHVAQPTLRPRKVRGGVKLASKSGPVSTAWAGQRWMRLVEELADGAVLNEGIEYARAGQARALNLNAGHIHARVQGRMPQAYAVDVRLPVLTFEQWDEVIALMVNEARPLAALLSGEVPPNIEDFFQPLRLHLFPAEASHLAVSCSCGQARAQLSAAMASAGQKAQPGSPAAALTSAPLHQGPWCKHVCCVMALVAERLGQDAFLMVALRGLGKDDLLERLRQKRAIAGPRAGGSNAGAAAGSAVGGAESEGSALAVAPDRPVPVYAPRVAGVTDVTLAPLDQHLDRFWAAGAELEGLDLPMDPPAVTHALLRRLGPSPFPAGRFPLLGLLSTCYSVISEQAAQGDSGAPSASTASDETEAS